MPQINWDAIPAELIQRPHWVVWKYEERDGKSTKVLYNANKPKFKAMSNKAATWADFDTARTTQSEKGFDGVGFVVSPDANLVGVDLDHCFDPTTGVIEPWALSVVESLQTYTEITPSGEGLRCFGWGGLPPKGRKKGDFECYNSGRFLTVTGHELNPGAPIAEITEALAIVHRRIFGEVEPLAPIPSSPSGGATLDDQDVLDKMFASKQGAKAETLYAGDFAGAGYASHSEADSAFCFMLAFWTGRDASAIDRLFRTSGLMREKWDARHEAGGQTYGQMTIARAVASVQQTYSPQGAPCIIKGRKKTSAYIAGTNPNEVSEEDVPETEDEDERQMNRGLYGIQNGRTVLMVSKEKADANGSSDVTAKHFVCDFAAHIVGETHSEEGISAYQIEGVTIKKTAFSLQIPASEIADARKMAGRLANVKGAGIGLHAGMEKHLGPSIEAFTDHEKLVHTHTFERTGWTHDLKEFLIPGLEKPNTEIHLDKALAYRIARDGPYVAEDVETLLSAHLETLTPIVCCHALLAPLARLADLQDEKFATFAVGRSGTLKTSWHQMGMSIYGDFGADDKLLKLGAGGTALAMAGFPAAAADMPLLFDNFKPGTGNGQKDATTLVHSLLEGTERKRLNRDGTQRTAREYRCWPQFTGEDTISDAASIARMLIVGASDPSPEQIQALTKLQENAHRLPCIGGAWLSWLLTDEARVIIEREKGAVATRRGYWVATLRKKSKEMVNAMRVATSLSLCEFAWNVAMQCPAFGDVLSRWYVRFSDALIFCADGMTSYSAQSHEANRYLATLRSLIISQKAYLQENGRDPDKSEDREFIGWQDEERIYLYPEAAYVAVTNALRSHPQGLNGLGENTIAKQLDQLNFLDQKDGAKYAPKRKMGIEMGRVRVLILRREKFFDDED